MKRTSSHQGNLPRQTPLASRSITVVIPALNEEGNLEKLLHLIDKAFVNLGFTLPVLLIDDGSTDSSPQILVDLQRSYSYLKVITHPAKRGVTAVWQTAIANTNTDWIFWGQADLESNPELDIPLLLHACTKGVHGVAGWRQNRGDGKKLASKIANTTCRLLFGLKIHDMNWIKLVPRDLVATLPLEVVTHRYLLAALSGLGHNITEVPTPWFPRHSGVSKFGKKRLLSSSLDFIRAFRWFISERFSRKSPDSASSQNESSMDTSGFHSQG
jgi:dolichol-phosphate mannosyltransferase